jgi:uncharacterized protein (DUF885 family)
MDEALQRLIDDYITATNVANPVAATGRGFHEHDANLGDRGAVAIESRAAEVRAFLDRLGAIDRSALTGGAGHDAALLERRLRWELAETERVRSWQRSPGAYVSMLGGGLNGLVIRDFAPLEERVRSLVARLEAAPALLEQAKANLADPSVHHVETAMEAAAGLQSLLRRDLAEAVAPCPDEGLRAAFARASEAAGRAVADFSDWLRTDLLPKATTSFAWGEALFGDLLRLADAVDEPLDVLVRRGEEDLRAHQDLLREVAARIDAAAPPEEVVDRVSLDHPPPERLLAETEALLEDLRHFSVEAGLCTMPTEERIRVKETPAFSRSTTQAACSTPGPFERVAKEAYYYVTPPDAAWPADRVVSYLKFFNRWAMPGVTAHEAYPGHYVHLTYLQRAESKLGRYLMTTSTVEGWAHYVEQVMMEAGFGDGDPRLHLMQLREALLRLCRYRCAFGLHVEGWSFERGVEFFVKEGLATPVIAERETRRGILGPGYYAYTLGKHQILGLRERLRKRQGRAFDLRAFHDAFMQLPYPVSTIEQVMLAA